MNTQVITILALEPIYGSNAWWLWSDKIALNDYKEGRFISFSNKLGLKKFLNNLKK